MSSDGGRQAGAAHSNTSHSESLRTAPESYLKALRADFLPLLHPGDARFGLAHRLADEGRHAPRNPRLIVRGLDEAGHACRRETARDEGKERNKRESRSERITSEEFRQRNFEGFHSFTLTTATMCFFHKLSLETAARRAERHPSSD